MPVAYNPAAPSVVLSLADPQHNAVAAERAEAAGFASAWVTEFYDHSATVSLAAMALRTRSITLGSAIAYAFGRTPVVLAAEVRDLDALSDGRIIVGLGTGTRTMQRDWHGLAPEHTLARARELIEVTRLVVNSLHHGPVSFEGRHYRVAITPTVPVAQPRRGNVPLYLAAVNPGMVGVAAAVADGLITHPLCTQGYVNDVVRPVLTATAAQARRDEPLPIVRYLTCAVDDDAEVARRQAKAVIAFNSTVKTYDAVHRHGGFRDEAAAVRAAWARGDADAMIDAVSDRMLDATAIAGTPRQARSQYVERFSHPDDQVLLWPPAFAGLDGALRLIDAFAGLGENPTDTTGSTEEDKRRD